MLFVGQHLDEPLEHALARVGDRIDRVADAIDEALVVKGLPVDDLFEVGADLVFILLVADVVADVAHHLHDLDVRAAMLGSLEGGERRCHGGIGVRARGGNDAGRKGRVVAAAVLHMQHERDVEGLGLKLRVVFVRTEHHEDVFRRGEQRVRAVDVHALVVKIVAVGMVAVDAELR